MHGINAPPARYFYWEPPPNSEVALKNEAVLKESLRKANPPP